MREIDGRLRICLDLLEEIYQTQKYTNTLSLHLGKNCIPVIWCWKKAGSSPAYKSTVVGGLEAGH